ncbi:piwi domain containing protein, partial [Acanthamoeba castellanii str. Neff]
PAGGVFIKRRVLSANKDQLGRHDFWGELLFAKQDLSNRTFKAEVNGTEYVVTLSGRIPVATDDVAAPERMAMASRLLKTVFARLKFIRIRDSIYDPTHPLIFQDMRAFPGYSTNIDLFHSGLMLNVDTSYKWVQTRSILDLLVLHQRDRAKQNQLVANQSVITNYTDKRGDYRFYRVSSIDFDKTPASTFPRRKRREHKYAEAEEELISFYDYYQETHGITIRHMEQPLLKVVEKRRRPTDGVQVEEIIYLVPELCVLAGMTEEMRTNGQLRRKAMEATGPGPRERMNSLISLVKKLQPGHQIPDRAKPGEMIDPGAILADWGLHVESEPLAVQGRQVRLETLRIGAKAPKPLGGKSEWRDLYGKPPSGGAPPDTSSTGLLRPMSLNAANWALFYTQRQESDVMNMMKAFHTWCGVNRKAEREGKPIKMFQVVLESASEVVYKSIKAVMASKPVQTQCVQQRTIKPQAGIESKVKGLLQQMVCKLGGAPWGGSVLALTATLDAGFTSYFSDVSVQAPVMASSIAESFDKALRAFKEVNPKYRPRRIIIYRDDPGGRGSLDALLENEIKPIQAVLQKRDLKINLAIIVVRKRGLVRLFTRRDMNNPPPGTIVDVGVVSRDYDDFYLIAHSSRMGTVKPTQYQIAYRTPGEDKSLTAQSLQRLSFMLCHLYYNFMGTIAEPAPLRYADRLASLMTQVLENRRMPRAELSTSLYYL